jgi:hypothetical protein
MIPFGKQQEIFRRNLTFAGEQAMVLACEKATGRPYPSGRSSFWLGSTAGDFGSVDRTAGSPRRESSKAREANEKSDSCGLDTGW